jgi:hypothetical protein
MGWCDQHELSNGKKGSLFTFKLMCNNLIKLFFLQGILSLVYFKISVSLFLKGY